MVDKLFDVVFMLLSAFWKSEENMFLNLATLGLEKAIYEREFY